MLFTRSHPRSRGLGHPLRHYLLLLALLVSAFFTSSRPVYAVAPTAVGVVTATVSIANDDSNENPYTFVVGGAGVTANAQLNGADCLLIDAINAANTDTAVGTCPAGSGADTITLLSDVVLSSADNNVINGLPQINSTITIQGAGYTISRAAGAPLFRFFATLAGANLTLAQVTLQNGSGSASGGAIYMAGGLLTVNNSTFTGNSTSGGEGLGGAIMVGSSSTLTVNNSTFTGNSATSGSYRDGGAIYSEGTLSVNNSTFSGNSAQYGGAITNYGTLTVRQSTFTGNSAASHGGVFGIVGNTTLQGNLISGNSAPNGSAINYASGTLNFTNNFSFR